MIKNVIYIWYKIVVIVITMIKAEKKKTIIYNYHVIPNLKSVNTFDSTCSLRFGLLRAMYNASKFFLVLLFKGALAITRHWNLWSWFSLIWLAGSDLWGGRCSFHLCSQLRFVSPIYVLPHEQTPSYILQAGWLLRSFNGNSVLVFFVIHFMATLYLDDV